MNILDLKKGDKVFTGVTRTGNGFANNVEYIEEMEVRDIKVNLMNDNVYATVRLAKDDKVQSISNNGTSFVEASMSVENFKDGLFFTIPSKEECYEYLTQKTGCQVNKFGTALNAWRWNEYKRIAEEVAVHDICTSIFRYELPDGCYPTRETCEKANKRMVTIEVTRTFMTQREEGADAEWLLNNPDEYEFQDGDECISDAQYAD